MPRQPWNIHPVECILNQVDLGTGAETAIFDLFKNNDTFRLKYLYIAL
jgi:hypothetical protein